MKNRRTGACIITLVAPLTVVEPFAADWNATHSYISHPTGKFFSDDNSPETGESPW